MKTRGVIFFLTLLMSMVGIRTKAHDIAVANSDGVTIYYIWTNNGSELAVSYQGYNYSYSNEYSGDVVIPESVTYNGTTYYVTSIGNSAFRNCSGLTSVTIPNSVTSIGYYAFKDCSGLKKVIVPDIAAWCNISFEIYPYTSSIDIDRYTTNPLYYAHHLYSDENTEITELVIPEGVTTIGHCAFYSCYLESVTISNSVTSISYNAFYGSTIRSVTIGTGVLSIGQGAFSNPTKVIWLTNTPPDGYRNAEGKVNYVANNQYWFNNNAIVYPFLSSLFEVDGVKYVPVSPSDRTCDAIDCRYDDSAEKIHIGKTVTNKGVTLTVMQVHPYAFYYNQCVKDVDLSFDGSVGNYAFYGCWNMHKAVVKNTGNIGDYAFSYTGEESFSAEINNAGEIGLNAFSSTSLTTLDIGNKVTNIKDNAFNGCTVLKTAMINNKGSLGNSVFQKCTALETATLGETITSLGTYAFDGCSSLKCIVIPNAVKSIGKSAFQNCSAMETVKMGTGVKSIGSYTFSGCSSLRDMQIGTNVATINTYAFSGCKSLPIIRIPRAVTDINNSVFNNCSGLKTVIMDDRDKVLNLGSNSKNGYDFGNPLFSDCPLDSVYIGGNISYNTNSNYGYSPFYRNTSLRTVVITDKETEISENEFYGCTNLQDVKIGDGVESFGDWAFSGCSSLKNFSFGMSVETIGKEAFSDCTAMERIYSRSPQPPVCGSQALDDINKWNCMLTVPAGNKAAYQAADQWKEFFFVEEGEAVNKYINITVEKSEGGKVLVNGTEAPESIKIGSDVELQFIPEEGYSLTRVLVNSDDVTAKVTDGKYTVTAANVDLTIKVTFGVNQYTLTYLVDGEEYKTLQVDYKATITPEPDPVKEGYTFSGWSEIPETMPAYDVTVTGTFSLSKYKLIYMVDGEEYKTFDVEYGATITPEEEPTKEGYTFSGWSYIPKKMPAEDVTVTGSFSVNSYTLTYMIDEVVYKQVMYEFGATVTPEPQPEGDYKTFEWVGLPETMPAHDVTVTAVYETGIAEIMMMAKQGLLRIYSPNGKKLGKLQKGLNIVVMQDGTTRKVVVK